MATKETEFSTQLRGDMEKIYGQSAKVWPTNDMFQVGVPDFNVAWQGNYFSIEAKFVAELPKRESSKVLSHEVSAKQAYHLERIVRAGCYGAVVIGLRDVMVVTTIVKNNYTLKEILAMKRFERKNGMWQVAGILEYIKEMSQNGRAAGD